MTLTNTPLGLIKNLLSTMTVIKTKQFLRDKFDFYENYNDFNYPYKYSYLLWRLLRLNKCSEDSHEDSYDSYDDSYEFNEDYYCSNRPNGDSYNLNDSKQEYINSYDTNKDLYNSSDSKKDSNYCKGNSRSH